jgi:Protein of unknown function (DUF3352)
MKRVVSSSIISVVILLLLAAGFFYFQLKKNISVSVYELIPADVAWIVSMDPSSGDLQRLANSSFLSGCDSVEVLRDWNRSLIFMDSICSNNEKLKTTFKSTQLMISGHVTGPSAFSLMYFAEVDNDFVKVSEELISLMLQTEGTVMMRVYNGIEIREFTGKNGANFTWAVAKGVFIGSATSFLIEDAIRQQKNSKLVSPAVSIQKYCEEQPKELMVALYYPGFTKWLKTQFRDPSGVNLAPLERLGDWSILNVQTHTSLISFHGQTLATDSSTFVHLFDQQTPVERKLVQMLPAKTSAAVVWGMSDASIILKTIKVNQKKSKQPSSSSELLPYFEKWIGEEIALVVTQPAGTLSDNNYLSIVHVKNTEQCKRSLESMVGKDGMREEVYNGYAIRYIDRKWIMKDLFGPLFTPVNRFYYSVVGNYLIIGNQASVIRAYINDYKTNNLLVMEDRYKALAAHVPRKGNIFFYCSIPQSEKVFSSIAAPAWVTWLASYGELLKNWNGLTFSISNSNGLYATSGCLGYFNKNTVGPQLAWNNKLDTTIAVGPFMPAGINGLILVQDVSNQLYAFDHTGNIAWKKKLESRILGEVNAVDYHQQQGNQYLLNTHSFIFLFDSLGTEVGNYPFRLPAEASAGLSLIKGISLDDSRYYIPCRNLRLYGYNLSGKPVAGLGNVKLPGVVQRSVLINEKAKRFILLDESGLCFTMDLAGNRTNSVKEKIFLKEGENLIPSMNEEDLFFFIGNTGHINRVGSEGSVIRVFDNDADSVIAFTYGDINGDMDPDWIISNSNGINFRTGDNVSLFKYNSTEPFISLEYSILGEKVFVAASTEQRLFWFNRDGSLAEGFPLAGRGKPIINKGTSSEKYLLIKGGDDNISLYILQ